jgi:hypothetical protein
MFFARIARACHDQPPHALHNHRINFTLFITEREPPCPFRNNGLRRHHPHYAQSDCLSQSRPAAAILSTKRTTLGYLSHRGRPTSYSCQRARAALQGLSRPHRHCADTSPSMQSVHPLYSPPGVDIGRVGPPPTVSTKNQPACGSLSCPGDTRLRLFRLRGDMHSRAHCLPGSGRPPIRRPDNIRYSGFGL